MTGGSDATNAAAVLPATSGLPMRLARVIGRDAAIDALDAALNEHRVVTVVGPGGIGKSTVALATAERRIGRRARGVRFLDLAVCRESSDVIRYAAGALDLDPGRASSPEALAALLSGQALLLVLDNCEHVIDAAAELANQLVMAASDVHLLTTSREALRIAGERVYRLPSLEVPPFDEAIGADEAQQYSAVALFFERAAAATSRFELLDADVPVAVEICRRLDGIPLAIELAAARVDTFGVRQLAARLDDRFQLLTDGRRTAMPRHQTLAATLDWSYATLSESERAVLTRFCAFRGAFSLSAAITVVGDEEFTPAEIMQAVADLAAKSLLAAQPSEDGVRYRLLETTRHYGWQKLVQRPDRNDVLRRHARACLDQLAGAREDLLRLRREQWTRRYGALVADVQDALEWAFSADGDPSIGFSLTAGAAPLGEQLVLDQDYFRRLDEVVTSSDGEDEQTKVEVAQLGHALAHAQIQLRGDLRSGRATIERIAGAQDPSGERLPEVMAAEVGSALLSGEYPAALRISGEIEEFAIAQGDAGLEMLAARAAAQANYFLGNFADARVLAKKVIDSPFEYLPHSMNNHKISMRVVWASCAAVQDDFTTALDLSKEAIRLGRLDNPLTLCLALALGGIPVAIWTGQEALARDWLAEAREIADRSAAGYWQRTVEQLARAADIVWGTGEFQPGDPEAEDMIGPTTFDMLPTFSPVLFSERTLGRVKAGTVGWNAAEVLRLAAMRAAARQPAQAVEDLLCAARLAQNQGAVLWSRRIDNCLVQLAPLQQADLSSE